jgi:hypothetical protein
MARGSSLSDDRVIKAVNANFIAVDNNVTDQGWPADTPALAPWQRWLENHPDNAQKGFTTSVVIAPDGVMSLGTSGSGYIYEWHTSVCYDPDKYLGFLNGSLQKYRDYQTIMAEPNPFKRGAKTLQLVRDVAMENRSRSHPPAAAGQH